MNILYRKGLFGMVRDPFSRPFRTFRETCLTPDLAVFNDNRLVIALIIWVFKQQII